MCRLPAMGFLTPRTTGLSLAAVNSLSPKQNVKKHVLLNWVWLRLNYRTQNRKFSTDRRAWSVPACLALVCAQFLWAGEPAPSPAGIFTDNMVLQRDVPVPVWGTAPPGEKIVLNFAGQTKTAVAGQNGQWKIMLEPLKLSSVPAEMTIKGTSSITLTNILVGDVWVCSGQSNMAWPVADMNKIDPSDGRTGVLNGEEEIAQADYPLMRLNGFGANYGHIDSGEWKVCSPQSLRGFSVEGHFGFSAVGYFFGEKLHRELKVPIGLINRSSGGTPIEAWIPLEAMKQDPYCRSMMEQARNPEILGQINQWRAELAKWLKEWQDWGKTSAQGKNPEALRPSPLKNDTVKNYEFYTDVPGTWYDVGIAPVIPYAVKGFIWYQGESNAQTVSAGLGYQKLLTLLIASWREKWQQGPLPFYWVQLPLYQGGGCGTAWQVVRESMLKTLQVANTGMAVTVDLGERDSLHPKNKRSVGERLARLALANAYGEKIVCSGPFYRGYQIKGNKVTVDFDHAARGLKSSDGTSLKCFEIAGSDRAFIPAHAEIVGNQVEVSSERVLEPVAVRFCFKETETPNLANSEGLPASPFRTDTWELESATAGLDQGNSALIPVPQLEAWWTRRHEEKLAAVRRGGIDLLFIGDSITQNWEAGGKAVWDEYYGNRNALNLGYGGDRTEIVLWRFAHGEIDGIGPKLAVVMIGSNNWGNSPEEIAAGVDAVVKTLRKKLPGTKVLLLAILPRGDLKPELRERHVKANALIAGAMHDDAVHFLNMNSLFLDTNGMASKLLLPDGGHPNEKGYRVWAEAIEPTVAELLGDAVRRKQ